MKKGREIISLPIQCQATNCMLGEVKDLLYDFEAHRVIALVVEPEGWLKGAKIIKFGDISLASEQVLIRESALIKNGKHDDEAKKIWERRHSIFGQRILNRDGELVGIVADTLLEEETGTIVGYELSNGVVEDLLTGRQTLMLSELEAQNYLLEPNHED